MASARTTRRVLFHAYHFPPLGGPGVQRPARMVRYLPDFGYTPIVLTGSGGGSDEWTPADETLLVEIPEGSIIHRVAGIEPTDQRWRHRAERWLRVPSPWARWWVDGSVAMGEQVGSDADVVYSWMQPYASAWAGARIAGSLGKPWIADFGDPWVFDEMIAYPSRFHRSLELAKMRNILAKASAIVVSTDEAAARFREHLQLGNGIPVVTIPNGFDQRDFAASPPRRSDDAFRIVHTGYLHTTLGRKYERFARIRSALGGTKSGVDVLTRSHVYLVQAINRLLMMRPELRSILELDLVGVVSESDRRVAAGQSFVHFRGYVSHREAVAALRSADLLFLPMHDLENGSRATIVPGKTYEYLASGTPILAAVPAGDARDLLAGVENAAICDPKDVEGMSNAIAQHIRWKKEGRSVPAPPAALLRQYEYRNLAHRLADVFDAVLS